MDEFAVRARENAPVNDFQVQLHELLTRYEADIADNPAATAALLVEYVDSLRLLYDLDVDGGHVSDEILGVTFTPPDGAGSVGWLNAPRIGAYHDIDREAFEAASEVPVEITGDPEEGTITFEFGEDDAEPDP
jgi:hypothetical protein